MNSGTLHPLSNEFTPVTRRQLSSLIAVLAAGIVLLVLNFSALSIAAVSLLVLWLSFLRYDPLLYLIVFTLPLAPIVDIEGFPIHDLATFARLLLFAGVLGRKLLEQEALGPWLWGNRMERWGLAFFAIAVISAAVVHPLEGGSARSLFRLASYILFYYAVTGWVRKTQQLRNCLMWLFASTIVVCALALHQVASNSLTGWFEWLYHNQMDMAPPWQGRPTSLFLAVNSLAAHLNMVIPFALAVQTWPKLDFDLRFSARLVLFLGIIVLVLTLSRGGFISFFVIMVIAFQTVLLVQGARWKSLLPVILAVSIGVAISYVAVTALSDSTGTSAAERFSGADEVTLVRGVIYVAAFGMFLNEPVLGIGYGNFRSHFNAYTSTGPDDMWDAHSLYFKFLAEIGLVGTLCFLAFIGSILLSARRSWRKGANDMERVVGAALLGSVAGVLVQGLVEALIENPQFGSMLWFLFAMLAVAQQLGRQDSQLPRKSAV